MHSRRCAASQRRNNNTNRAGWPAPAGAKPNSHFMQPQEPQFDPDHNSENSQSIVERMFRAKWLSGHQLVRPEQFWVNLNALGQQRIGKICDALIKAAPDFFKPKATSVLTADSVRQPSAIELLAVQAEIQLAIGELQPPPFSPGERDTLLSMFCVIARERCTGSNPPSRGFRPPAS